MRKESGRRAQHFCSSFRRRGSTAPWRARIASAMRRRCSLQRCSQARTRSGWRGGLESTDQGNWQKGVLAKSLQTCIKTAAYSEAMSESPLELEGVIGFSGTRAIFNFLILTATAAAAFFSQFPPCADAAPAVFYSVLRQGEARADPPPGRHAHHLPARLDDRHQECRGHVEAGLPAG